MNIIINYYIVSSVCLSVSSVLSDCNVPGVAGALSDCSVPGVAGVLSDCSVSSVPVTVVSLVSIL